MESEQKVSQPTWGSAPWLIAIILFDIFSWIAAVVIGAVLRFEFDTNAVNFGLFVALGSVAGILQALALKLIGLYDLRFPSASFDQLVALAISTFVASAPLTVITLVWGPELGVPRSIFFIATPVFLLMAGLSRFGGRLGRLKIRVKDPRARPALIYGAGSMAEILVPHLAEDKESLYVPVGLIDDDPLMSKRWISGVRTLGNFNELRKHVSTTKASVLIVAIPRADSQLLQRVRDVAEPLGLEVVVLPTFSQILSSQIEGVELTSLGIEDLIGRRAVEIDSRLVGSYITGKTVLITGAGGSIGIELCRQVSMFKPKRLISLDRDETGLQQAQLAVSRSGLLDDADTVLADIRDASTLEKLFMKIQPDVVFHAAALKHLPVLEKFPGEAWKTNVLGTENVLNAASKAGVSILVNISTDKAADPSSFLGRSKRLAEQLTSWHSLNSKGQYLSVRFGNVLGSRGSLVPTLAYLIDKGGPVTVTHPDATRYFMTTSEACQLVLQAGAEQEVQAVLVLDMGRPVRILDIAEKMISMSGKSVEIVFTGLRTGEKLHESLSSFEEDLDMSSHPLVWKVHSVPLDPKLLMHHRQDFFPDPKRN